VAAIAFGGSKVAVAAAVLVGWICEHAGFEAGRHPGAPTATAAGSGRSTQCSRGPRHDSFGAVRAGIRTAILNS
jgi:hypothetical protein